MHHVRTLFSEELAEPAYLAQDPRMLLAEGQLEVLAAALDERRHEAPAGRRHQRSVAGGNQRIGDQAACEPSSTNSAPQ